LLSDPGQFLVKECIDRNIKIVPIPGVSSITASMSVSGFSDKFLFYGFLPKKERELESVLKNLSNYKFSQVFFIPALKISFYIKNIQKYFHDRKLIIAKEITKVHENFYRGEVKNFKTIKIAKKGEITLIISEKSSMSSSSIWTKQISFLVNPALSNNASIFSSDPVVWSAIFSPDSGEI